MEENAAEDGYENNENNGGLFITIPGTFTITSGNAANITTGTITNFDTDNTTNSVQYITQPITVTQETEQDYPPLLNAWDQIYSRKKDREGDMIISIGDSPQVFDGSLTKDFIADIVAKIAAGETPDVSQDQLLNILVQLKTLSDKVALSNEQINTVQAERDNLAAKNDQLSKMVTTLQRNLDLARADAARDGKVKPPKRKTYTYDVATGRDASSLSPNYYNVNDYAKKTGNVTNQMLTELLADLKKEINES